MGKHSLRDIAGLRCGLPSRASGLIQLRRSVGGSEPRAGSASSVRFLGEATDLPKRDYVRKKADHQQPGTAFHQQNQAPAENYSNHQIGDNRPKQFHAGILSHGISRASSETIRPNAELAVWEPGVTCAVTEQRVPEAKMVSRTQAYRGGPRADSLARELRQHPGSRVAAHP
jgi:hypothetical protein